MNAVIMIMLFIGMFLVVQSVYEDKVRHIEKDYESKMESTKTMKMYESGETKMKDVRDKAFNDKVMERDHELDDVFKTSFAFV